MATTIQAPQLTPNNRIYLYRLLSRELGCGKQTFMPAVEEALASDRMGAEDLGFESTRALLEALEEFVKLTVFKGGRIYATVMAQPAWDEALATLESGKAKDAGGPSNKPWKRKKTDKSLKPVRPKRVKRAEPAPDPAPAAKERVAEAAIPTADGDGASARGEASSVEGDLAEIRTEAMDMVANTVANTAHTGAEDGIGREVEATAASGTDEATVLEKCGEPQPAEADPQPSPAISLTVTYDPYSGIDREMKLESHPVTPKPEQAPPKPTCAPSQVASSPAALSGVPAPSAPGIPPAHIAPQNAGQPDVTTALQTAAAEQGHVPLSLDQPAAAAQPAAATQPVAAAQPVVVAQPTAAVQPAAATMPAPLSPAVLTTYPTDFSTEVYLSSERIADLCELLPYGTDVFTLLTEDYARARALELISGTRARATFPLRIQHADSIEPIRVSLKKRSGSSLQWELSAIE